MLLKKKSIVAVISHPQVLYLKVPCFVCQLVNNSPELMKVNSLLISLLAYFSKTAV